jgi:hypothetical protein
LLVARAGGRIRFSHWAFAALGALFSLSVFFQSSVLYFYQSYMPEMACSACGFGFLHPVEVPRPYWTFLLPVILTAVLAPGWQDRSMHRAFGGFPVDGNVQ